MEPTSAIDEASLPAAHLCARQLSVAARNETRLDDRMTTTNVTDCTAADRRGLPSTVEQRFDQITLSLT
jgi:hypothetical protein